MDPSLGTRRRHTRTDPSLRPEAYLNAARSGSTVRFLLNRFTIAGYENGNPSTIARVQSTAGAEELDRQPAWRDTDPCSADFRDWSFPSPGELTRSSAHRDTRI